MRTVVGVQDQSPSQSYNEGNVQFNYCTRRKSAGKTVFEPVLAANTAHVCLITLVLSLSQILAYLISSLFLCSCSFLRSAEQLVASLSLGAQEDNHAVPAYAQLLARILVSH